MNYRTDLPNSIYSILNPNLVHNQLSLNNWVILSTETHLTIPRHKNGEINLIMKNALCIAPKTGYEEPRNEINAKNNYYLYLLVLWAIFAYIIIILIILTFLIIKLGAILTSPYRTTAIERLKNYSTTNTSKEIHVL